MEFGINAVCFGMTPAPETDFDEKSKNLCPQSGDLPHATSNA
jgi:hypothetical protein